MKKFALLLLAISLAACTSPTPEQRATQTPEQSARLKTTQLAQAVSACSDKPDYWRCVNNFSRQQYGWHVERLNDGSVTLADDTSGPIRVPVGKPLQEAQALAAQKNYKAAMAKVAEAEAAPNQTALEIRVTAEMKEYIAGVSSRPSQP